LNDGGPAEPAPDAPGDSRGQAAGGEDGHRAAQAIMWLTRLVAAFLIVAAVLIAGYAPYTPNMYEILGIAGLLLVAAALTWGLGVLLQRISR
jgi:hypothetical protein